MPSDSWRLAVGDAEGSLGTGSCNHAATEASCPVPHSPYRYVGTECRLAQHMTLRCWCGINCSITLHVSAHILARCRTQVAVEEDITTPRRESALTAWVNVIYGCNEKCTYCVVPYTRGSEQSRKADDIKREMLALGEAGYKEVTLLGQNIDAYGRWAGVVRVGGCTASARCWRWGRRATRR